MGKVIVVGLTIITVVVIVAMVVVYFRRRQSKETAMRHGWATRGDLNTRQERALVLEVESAAVLFRRLLTPPTDLSGDMTFLRYDDRRSVENWLRNYVASSANNTRKGN